MTGSRVFFFLLVSTFVVSAGLKVFGFGLGGMAFGAEPDPPRLDPKPEYYLPIVDDGGLRPAKTTDEVATVLQTVALLTVLTLAPSILIMMTCFTRIIIVLGFMRKALATQTLPPDQVLVGLGLFLTLFIMAPTWEKAWDSGLKPFLDGEVSPQTGQPLSQSEAFQRVLAPQREFMFACLDGNEGTEDLLFFFGVSGHKQVDERGEYYIGADGRRIDAVQDIRREDISTMVLIPAFMTAELRRSFWMGFLLYIPFLILDLVISSVLMAMGMMMLPPVMISLPFKIILFVLVDGWRLLMEGLVTSFPLDVVGFANVIVTNH